MSYRITREIRPDCQAIIFEWSDRQSEQELLRDFPPLQHLGAHAFRHHRLSGMVWYRRLWSGLAWARWNLTKKVYLK
jgi:hypothetical protein